MNNTQRLIKLFPSVTFNRYWLVIDDNDKPGFKTIKDLTDEEQKELFNKIHSLFVDVTVEVRTSLRGTYFVDIKDFNEG
ncbi:MAG: hypothetical protein R3321_02510 [Nitrososphaeraceae archaeon]|nr:hypothetical protein [Nitrososphaeraceae archaeon]